jgi:hypothetical protein
VTLSAPVSPAEIRAYVADQLPDYMTPSAVVVLDAFPLNANGKVDRTQLPEPQVLADAPFRAPCGPAEVAVAGIFAELFETTRVSALDDFFQLGGHSLLGAQFAARVRSKFGVDFPLTTLFAAPTVHELAAELRSLLESRISTLSEDEAVALLRELA